MGHYSSKKRDSKKSDREFKKYSSERGLEYESLVPQYKALLRIENKMKVYTNSKDINKEKRDKEINDLKRRRNILILVLLSNILVEKARDEYPE